MHAVDELHQVTSPVRSFISRASFFFNLGCGCAAGLFLCPRCCLARVWIVADELRKLTIFRGRTNDVDEFRTLTHIHTCIHASIHQGSTRRGVWRLTCRWRWWSCLAGNAAHPRLPTFSPCACSLCVCFCGACFAQAEPQNACAHPRSRPAPFLAPVFASRVSCSVRCRPFAATMHPSTLLRPSPLARVVE
jgi:hypothetical protein